GGYLFLGASESAGPGCDLFEAIDKKQKLFRRKVDSASAGYRHHLPVHGGGGAARIAHPSLKVAQAPQGFHDELSAQREADRIILSRCAAASVLIDSELR